MGKSPGNHKHAGRSQEKPICARVIGDLELRLVVHGLQKQQCAPIGISRDMELSSSALLGLQVAGTLTDESFGSLLTHVLTSLEHKNRNGKERNHTVQDMGSRTLLAWLHANPLLSAHQM